MPAHRKTLKELAESGTLQRHLGKYKGRIEALKAKELQKLSVAATVPAKGAKPLTKRAPGHLSKEAKAAWREIVASAPDGTIVASDALLLEVTAKLLAKSRTEDLKPAALNQLAAQLAKWMSREQDACSVVANPSLTPATETKPDPDLADWEKFYRDDQEDQQRETAIREEMTRRKESGPLKGHTPKQYEHSCRWYEVSVALKQQHGWHPLYVA